MECSAIDSIDHAILAVLRTDGRVSTQALAERVGLSPTPTARRVRALERAGMIRGYGARLDEAAMGRGFAVFVSVKLDRQVEDALAAFEGAVQVMPEVMECWLMTGGRDYLLRVATKDLAAFERFLTGRLTRVPGVATIESAVPLREVKRT